MTVNHGPSIPSFNTKGNRYGLPFVFAALLKYDSYLPERQNLLRIRNDPVSSKRPHMMARSGYSIP
jgi:hypothetical protein